MAAEIKVRESWRHGPECSFEVEAYDGEKKFGGSSTVTRDRGFRGPLRVSVNWWSGGNDGNSIEAAEAHVAVMVEAVKLAKKLEANIEKLHLNEIGWDDSEVVSPVSDFA